MRWRSLVTQIDRYRRWGDWRSATFTECIREELACFAQGMSKDMKRKFNSVNISGGANNGLVDVTRNTIFSAYDSNDVTEYYHWCKLMMLQLGG